MAHVQRDNTKGDALHSMRIAVGKAAWEEALFTCSWRVWKRQQR